VALGTWFGKVRGLQYEAGLSATRKPWTAASSSRTCGLPGESPALWQSQQGVAMRELLQAQMSGNHWCERPCAGTWSGERGEAARAAGDCLEEASRKVLGCSPVDSWCGVRDTSWDWPSGFLQSHVIRWE